MVIYLSRTTRVPLLLIIFRTYSLWANSSLCKVLSPLSRSVVLLLWFAILCCPPSIVCFSLSILFALFVLLTYYFFSVCLPSIWPPVGPSIWIELCWSFYLPRVAFLSYLPSGYALLSFFPTSFCPTSALLFWLLSMLSMLFISVPLFICALCSRICTVPFLS